MQNLPASNAQREPSAQSQVQIVRLHVCLVCQGPIQIFQVRPNVSVVQLEAIKKKVAAHNVTHVVVDRLPILKVKISALSALIDSVVATIVHYVGFALKVFT